MLATPPAPRPQIEGASREPAAMAESIPPGGALVVAILLFVVAAVIINFFVGE